MRIIKQLLFLLTLICPVVCFPQAKKTSEREFKTFYDRFFYGSGFNLMFSTIDLIDVTPHAGVYINKRWRAGFAGIYSYYSNSLKSNSTHIWGVRFFTDFAVIKNIGDLTPVKSDLAIRLEVSYNSLSLQRKYFLTSANNNGRYLYHTALVGVGLWQPIGKRAAFFIKLLYNTNYMSSLPFDNPYIEFGFDL